MVLPLLLGCQASGLLFRAESFRERDIIHLATTTVPGPEFQPFPVYPFLPMHMGLHPSLLLPPTIGPLHSTPNASPNDITVNPLCDRGLQQHPAEYPPANNPSRCPLDNTNSKRLEYLLESALATALTFQASGISSSADILSPRAHNTLKALNALVSVEVPIPGPGILPSDSPARFKFVKKMAKWLRIPQSPNQDTPR